MGCRAAVVRYETSPAVTATDIMHLQPWVILGPLDVMRSPAMSDTLTLAIEVAAGAVVLTTLGAAALGL